MLQRQEEVSKGKAKARKWFSKALVKPEVGEAAQVLILKKY